MLVKTQPSGLFVWLENVIESYDLAILTFLIWLAIRDEKKAVNFVGFVIDHLFFAPEKHIFYPLLTYVFEAQDSWQRWQGIWVLVAAFCGSYQNKGQQKIKRRIFDEILQDWFSQHKQQQHKAESSIEARKYLLSSLPVMRRIWYKHFSACLFFFWHAWSRALHWWFGIPNTGQRTLNARWTTHHNKHG